MIAKFMEHKSGASYVMPCGCVIAYGQPVTQREYREDGEPVLEVIKSPCERCKTYNAARTAIANELHRKMVRGIEAKGARATKLNRAYLKAVTKEVKERNV